MSATPSDVPRRVPAPRGRLLLVEKDIHLSPAVVARIQKLADEQRRSWPSVARQLIDTALALAVKPSSVHE